MNAQVSVREVFDGPRWLVGFAGLENFRALQLKDVIDLCARVGQPNQFFAGVKFGQNGARFLKKPVFAPDEFPSRLELRIAVEEDWDNLGASLQEAQRIKSMRDALSDLGCTQVGAFRLANMPYQRNFFAYTKQADTFAALYLSDAAGPAPYLELFTLFRTEKNGKIGA